MNELRGTSKLPIQFAAISNGGTVNSKLVSGSRFWMAPSLRSHRTWIKHWQRCGKSSPTRDAVCWLRSASQLSM
jgi:hypothetical protein